jgi:hypothetical protein
MKYVLKVSNAPGGLQVSEQYKTLSGGTLDAVVLISTALPITLVTAETYDALSSEPTQPMDKNLEIGLPYIPVIPNPKRGLIKDFTLNGQIWGDLKVVVCDVEIGYPNPIIIGTDIIMNCKSFSWDSETVAMETE